MYYGLLILRKGNFDMPEDKGRSDRLLSNTIKTVREETSDNDITQIYFLFKIRDKLTTGFNSENCGIRTHMAYTMAINKIDAALIKIKSPS